MTQRAGQCRKHNYAVTSYNPLQHLLRKAICHGGGVSLANVKLVTSQQDDDDDAKKEE